MNKAAGLALGTAPRRSMSYRALNSAQAHLGADDWFSMPSEPKPSHQERSEVAAFCQVSASHTESTRVLTVAWKHQRIDAGNVALHWRMACVLQALSPSSAYGPKAL